MVQNPVDKVQNNSIVSNQKNDTNCICDKSITDTETGEIICSDCGQVLSEKIEDSQREWRIFQNDQKHIQRNRVGPGSSLAIHDKGLSTIIGSANKDASGNMLAFPMKYEIQRLRTWDGRILFGTQNRNFIRAFKKLDILKDKLALPFAIVEKSAYIYRKAHARSLMRGRKIGTVLAACVYAACRQSSITRTLNDISKAIDIRRVEIATCYRLIVNELDLAMPNIDPVNCVSRIASNVGTSEKVNRYAIKLIEKSVEIEFSAGKDPMGLAGAALYIACNKVDEHRSQQQIAMAANTSTVTIRNLAKDIVKKLEL